jgi:hypothetical protein
LRGGSWNNNQNNARVSGRNNNHPNNKWNNYGFRVVLAPHGLAFLPEVLADEQSAVEAILACLSACPYKGQK